MINKKLILLILLFIISLTTISATEFNDTQDIQQDTIEKDATTNTLQSTQETPVKIISKVQSSKTKESTTKTVHNYDELYDVLTSDEECNLDINLEGDQKYVITKNVTLNENIKNLKINGNGRIIDGQHNTSFLTLNNTNMVINNITVSNCNDSREWIYVYYATTYAHGAAINVFNTNLTLNNSVFDHHFATATEADGAAIYVENTILNINNCIFANNNLSCSYEPHGGAIFSYESNVSINNSLFKNNDIARTYDTSYIDGYGGAIYGQYSNYTVNNSQFFSNKARVGSSLYLYGLEHYVTNCWFENNTDSDGVIYNGASRENDHYTEDDCGGNLTVINVTFNKNKCDFMEYIDGSIITNYGNLLVNNSYFTNNIIDHEEAINIGLICHYGSKLTMDNTLFENNNLRCLSDSGALICIDAPNASISNSKFINNNILTIGEEGYGGVIRNDALDRLFIDRCDFINNSVRGSDTNGGAISSDSNLTVTSSNFINNTVSSINDQEVKGGAICCQYGDYYIMNCNFTNNSVKSNSSARGGAICADNCERLIVNYCEFNSNTIQSMSETASGGAISVKCNFFLNNSNFYNNSITSKGDVAYGGAVDASESSNLTVSNCNFYLNSIVAESSCDVREGALYATSDQYKIYSLYNSVFVNNTPPSFIVKDNQIMINNENLNNEIEDYTIPLQDKVTIYIDDSTEGETYDIVDSVVKDFVAPDDAYALKLVISKTDENSQDQEYENNTYYVKMKHNFTLSVDAYEVNALEDEMISGYFYLNRSTDALYFKNKTINLYVNGSYINSTKTNEEGYYFFKYPATAVGIQEVTIIFPGDEYIDILSNYTNFNVNKLKTKLNINSVNEVTLHDKINITGKLSDEKDRNIANETITLYINNNPITLKTEEDGEFRYEYTTIITGENHVLAVHDESYYYQSSEINTTNFKVNKIGTILTVNATNTTLNNNTTINGKLTDKNNKAINDAKIIFFVDEDKITVNTNDNGEFNHTYIVKYAGNNYVEVFYEGNDTYNDSITNTIFIVNKTDTNPQAKIITQKIGNLTINVSIVGKDGKQINNGTITLSIDDNELRTYKIKDTTTTITLKDAQSGTYTYTITYNGNDTYNPSSTQIPVSIKQESNIGIEFTNTTEGNVTIELTVTDETGNSIKEQEVNITLPNGTTVTEKTDEEGKITITDNTCDVGDKKVTASITGTVEIEGTTTTKNITVTPNYQKIIENMNKTIVEQNKTIDELNKNIDDQNKIINSLEEENQDLKDENKDLKDENQDLKDKIDTHNKTSNIKAVPTNGTVGNTNILVSLDNQLGQPITNAPITITNNKGELIGNATTDEEGIATIPVDTKAGTENITVNYAGDNNHTPVNKTISVTTTKNNVTVTVDSVNGIIGENITLTAHITDINGNQVSGGNLVFKLNGKTLRVDGRFDSSASAWKFNVKDGIVTIIIQADLYLRNAKNLTASYSGSYKYKEAKSATVVAQIKKRNAQLTLTLSPTKQKQYQTITFTAKLTDTTPNYKNTTAINTNTKVIFKVNDKTVQDDNGNVIKVKVTNGQASYKYTVPQGMGGINKDGQTRNYNVSAVLVSDTFYPDTRAESFFNVERSAITINITNITLNKNNKLCIKATINDYKNNTVIGINKVNIKINGKSYVNPKNNKIQNFMVKNGVLDLSELQLNKNITVKKIQVVTGERQAYLGQRIETTNIVKV